MEYADSSRHLFEGKQSNDEEIEILALQGIITNITHTLYSFE
jgi:hypothetical protein